jgi:soluble lytic murein transglycosylase-like protein
LVTPATLAVAMAAMLAPRAPTRAEATTLRIIAAQIVLRAGARGMDPLLVAAVIHHESGFRVDARGAAGELGLGQLKRGTLAIPAKLADASDEALMSVPINVSLTVRHLAHVRAKCGHAPPVAWISVYKGIRRCAPSRYSRAILAEYALGRAALDALGPEVAKAP